MKYWIFYHSGGYIAQLGAGCHWHICIPNIMLVRTGYVMSHFISVAVSYLNYRKLFWSQQVNASEHLIIETRTNISLNTEWYIF